MAAELRANLRAAVNAATPPKGPLGTRIAARFARIGLRDSEDIPDLRGYAPKPATFD